MDDVGKRFASQQRIAPGGRYRSGHEPSSGRALSRPSQQRYVATSGERDRSFHERRAACIVERLDIAFRTRALRDACEKQAEGERQLGSRVAQALWRRLADLRAATTVDEVVAGHPEALTEDGSQLMVFTLTDEYQLIVAPGHNNMPVLDSGEMDWARVTRVKVIRIERRHD